MTVAELVEQLLKLPQDLIVRVSVADFADCAFTMENISIYQEEEIVEIIGYAVSEDERSHIPWSQISEDEPEISEVN